MLMTTDPSFRIGDLLWDRIKFSLPLSEQISVEELLGSCIHKEPQIGVTPIALLLLLFILHELRITPQNI